MADKEKDLSSGTLYVAKVGAGFSLVRDGTTVVDLWGGWADTEATTPYGEDTLQLVFSSTKGPTALLAHMLAERGEPDLDAPVADPVVAAEHGAGDAPDDLGGQVGERVGIGRRRIPVARRRELSST